MGPDYLNNIAREFHGPGSFRFFIQPIIALILGLRDGRKDALKGRTPFFETLIRDHEKRNDLWKEGLLRISKPLAISILMDMVLQIIILGHWVPFQAVIVGSLLIALPYLVARGSSNRTLRRRHSYH
jgi:hypothetical protein